MNIYVIRHGQTNCNKLHKYNCRYNEDLNTEGINQASQVKNQLKNLDIDLIICSPLKRARHTADIINVNKLPIIYDYDLIEREGGKLTNTYIDSYFEKEYYNFYSNNIVEGLEPLPILFDRVHSFLDKIKTKYPSKNILLVTHGSVVRAIQFYFEPMPDDGMLLRVSGQKNCEIKQYKL